MGRILFRADGGKTIGWGHVVRSSALADILKEDFDVHFYIRTPGEALATEILIAGAQLHVLRDDISYEEDAVLLSEQAAVSDIVVLDGYQFGTEYQQIIKAKGCTLVCIDDIFEYHFLADAIINHGGGLRADLYSKEPLSRVYLGPRYALLRHPFLQQKRPDNQVGDDRIFVSMGGADTNNDTLKVLKFLEREGNKRYECVVILGKDYVHGEELEAFRVGTKLRIHINRGVGAEEMAELMKGCRYAICPPSTVSYEYLSLGGELYIHMTAENQKNIRRFFLESGIAFPMEDFPQEDTSKINRSREQRDFYFDGHSPSRLRNIFRKLTLDMELNARRASAVDTFLLHDWVSDPVVRKFALNSGSIPLDSHKQWFEGKLHDPHSFIYIVEYKGEPVGQVRFDVRDGHTEAMVDYSISREYRGKGWGESLIRCAGKAFKIEFGDTVVLVAIVKDQNVPSRKVFEGLQFEKVHEEWHLNDLCHTYTLTI